jgi:hypothetical protein
MRSSWVGRRLTDRAVRHRSRTRLTSTPALFLEPAVHCTLLEMTASGLGWPGPSLSGGPSEAVVRLSGIFREGSRSRGSALSTGSASS